MSQVHANSPLGTMSVETFLTDYWQKKPLLIRQAFPNFETPISPDELAGLACEEEINSRIVIEQGGDHPWQAIHGPMDEATFAKMPETHWTLVVNDLEKCLPELAWITDQFRFIPEWHLDDLMSSWAAPEGSVGPHIDLYDVFILQGDGKRRWQISTAPVADDNVIPDIAIRLQKDFIPEFEWILEPGDMMYLPAGVSHHGISIGESSSYSIGFRATSHSDLVNDFIAHITDDLSIKETYQLPFEALKSEPNKISSVSIDEVRNIFRRYLDPDSPELVRWFGQFVSDSKVDYLHECAEPIASIEQLQGLLVQENRALLRHPASRFAYTQETSQSCRLFIDGSDYLVSIHFATILCAKRDVPLSDLLAIANDKERDFIVNLYNSGKLYFEA